VKNVTGKGALKNQLSFAGRCIIRYYDVTRASLEAFTKGWVLDMNAWHCANFGLDIRHSQRCAPSRWKKL